jgi:hypothetical protein
LPYDIDYDAYDEDVCKYGEHYDDHSYHGPP